MLPDILEMVNSIVYIIGGCVLVIILLFISKAIRQRKERKKPLKEDNFLVDLEEFSRPPQIDKKDKKHKEKEIIEKYRKEVDENPLLREHGEKLINGKRNCFWKVFVVFCFLLLFFFVSAFVYQTERGKFKNSYIDNSTVVCQQPEIPPCPSFSCPEVTCGDCKCPEANITINEYHNSS